MIVNDLVKTIGYSRNRAKYFEFFIYDPTRDIMDGITITNITLDDYVYLCDQEVSDWICDSMNGEGYNICTVSVPVSSTVFIDFYARYRM